jgi:hypothetical protein
LKSNPIFEEEVEIFLILSGQLTLLTVMGGAKDWAGVIEYLLVHNGGG